MKKLRISLLVLCPLWYIEGRGTIVPAAQAAICGLFLLVATIHMAHMIRSEG